MAKMIRLIVCFCIALLFFSSLSNASSPFASLKKCNTPRKKYGLIFKKNSITLVDHFIDKKITYPMNKNSRTFSEKIKGYYLQKKIKTNLFTYTLYLKETNLRKSLDWSGHLTVSTFLSDRPVSFFFPLSCLNKNHLKNQIFIS
tara:strand:- start:407 stop:838 length:432 start_codon:yes stop_codon:yes gene_type:complete